MSIITKGMLSPKLMTGGYFNRILALVSGKISMAITAFFSSFSVTSSKSTIAVNEDVPEFTVNGESV